MLEKQYLYEIKTKLFNYSFSVKKEFLKKVSELSNCKREFEIKIKEK